MLSQWRWKLTFMIFQGLAQYMLLHLKQDLGGWPKQQTERLDAELLEVLRHEWARLVRELNRIPAAAAEVLMGFGAEASPGEESSELPISWRLTRPAFAKVEWHPKVPILRACLPVFAVRSSLRRHLSTEVQGLTDSCMDYMEDTLLESLREALSRVGSEVEKRAGEIESRIIQAMKGKRL